MQILPQMLSCFKISSTRLFALQWERDDGTDKNTALSSLKHAISSDNVIFSGQGARPSPSPLPGGRVSPSHDQPLAHNQSIRICPSVPQNSSHLHLYIVVVPNVIAQSARYTLWCHHTILYGVYTSVN